MLETSLNMPIQNYPYTLRRIGATVVDYAIVFGISFFYIFMVGTQDSPGHYKVTGFPALFPEAFWFVYIVLTERYLDGTLGHQLLKIKVVSIDGIQLHFWQVFLRRIMDALEITLCGGLIAFILVKAGERNQRLGDLVAKTRVVGKSDTYKEIKFDFEK